MNLSIDSAAHLIVAASAVVSLIGLVYTTRTDLKWIKEKLQRLEGRIDSLTLPPSR